MSNLAVINRHHYPNGLPGNAQYIGRGTPFGNPYKIEDQHDESGQPLPKERAREQSIALYRADVWTAIKSRGTDPTTQLHPGFWVAFVDLCDRIHTGQSIAIACSCHPLPCHGDVIVRAVEYANSKYDELIKPFVVLPEVPEVIWKVGDRVTWKGCPSAIAAFGTDPIKAISEDRTMIRLPWIRHWIAVSDCDLI